MTFGFIDDQICQIKEEIQEENLIDDIFGLDEEKMICKKAAQAELFRNLNLKHNLCVQKARSRWLVEGDVNSSLFHRVINYKRKKNEIVGMKFNGRWVEGVDAVKKGNFEHFKDHFSRKTGRRPLLSSNSLRRSYLHKILCYWLHLLWSWKSKRPYGVIDKI